MNLIAQIPESLWKVSHSLADFWEDHFSGKQFGLLFGPSTQELRSLRLKRKWQRIPFGWVSCCLSPFVALYTIWFRAFGRSRRVVAFAGFPIRSGGQAS